MEQRTLELTVISAKGLKKVNLITKMDVYVVVSISEDHLNQWFKTPVDKDSGRNPTWNFTLKFNIDEKAVQENRLSLCLTVMSERVLLGDKEIGEVRVPIKELLHSRESSNGKQLLSYQVRKPNGKPKGFISFSYLLSNVVGPTSYPLSNVVGTCSYPPPKNVDARVGVYPPAVHHSEYGYPPQQGSGYQQPVAQPETKSSNLGMGLGVGLVGGALGGMLLGDMVSDVVAYDASYDDGVYDDAGYDAGFDHGFFDF